MFEVGSSVSNFTSMHIIPRVISPSKFIMKWEKTPQFYERFCYVKVTEIIIIIIIKEYRKKKPTIQ